MPNNPNTPPKTGIAGSSATATKPVDGTLNSSATIATGVDAALQSVEQLRYTVDQLQHELQGYTVPGMVGRDTILLRSFFDQAVGRLSQIAQACKITWVPPQNAATGRR